MAERYGGCKLTEIGHNGAVFRTDVQIGQHRGKVKEYVRYFNHARPHQGIDGQIPIPISSPPAVVPPMSRLRRLPVLGGLHHDYQWAA